MVTHVQALPPNLPRPMQAGQGSWWVLGSREAPTSQPTQRGPRTHSLTPSRCAGPARTSPCGLWDLTCPPPPAVLSANQDVGWGPIVRRLTMLHPEAEVGSSEFLFSSSRS